MLRERHGGAFASGMTATGFWLGITGENCAIYTSEPGADLTVWNSRQTGARFCHPSNRRKAIHCGTTTLSS